MSNGDSFKEDKLEPIAVVGMSLKFPQDATSPEAFWEMLAQGRSAWSSVPADRFTQESFCAEGPGLVIESTRNDRVHG